jgi:class 3 adenylate cyclase
MTSPFAAYLPADCEMAGGALAGRSNQSENCPGASCAVTVPLTFLYTDLENSTPLWEKFPVEMRRASTRHDALMRGVGEQHRRRVVKPTGDGFHVVFESPVDGAAAALARQQAVSTDSLEIAEMEQAKTQLAGTMGRMSETR